MAFLESLLNVIVILIPFLLFLYFIIKIYDSWKIRRLRKKYNPNDDKSRRETRNLGGREFSKSKQISYGTREFEQRRILPPTPFDSVEQDRRTSKKSDELTNFFKKLRK